MAALYVRYFSTRRISYKNMFSQYTDISLDRSVGIVAGCTAEVRFMEGKKNVYSFHMVQASWDQSGIPAYVTRAIYGGLSGRGRKLTTHLHLLPRW
jgi:hypothetical protein